VTGADDQVNNGRFMRRLPKPVAVVTVLAALAMAACSSGGSGSKRGSGQGANRATGTPLTLGFLNMENAPLGSFPAVREGAEAAVRHVNEDLGGVANHPIQLEMCTTDGTTEASRLCATKLVAKHPVAVVGGIDLGAFGSLGVFDDAQLPYVGSSPTVGDELTLGGSYQFTGGTFAELLAEADYAITKLGAKKIAIVHVDLPGLLSTVVDAADFVLRRRGATDVKVVAEKADVADFAPALTAATRGRPDAILVVFPPQSCSRIMAARASLAITVPTFYPGACADREVVDAAGAAADQAWFGSGFLPVDDSNDGDVATYRRFAGDGRTAGQSVLRQAGFSTVMNLRRLLGEAGGASADAASLRTKLEESGSHPNFMAHEFSCDRHQLPLMQAVCNPWVRLLQLKSGRFRDAAGEWVTGAELVKLFG